MQNQDEEMCSICNYKRDRGRFVLKEDCLQFYSLHHNIKINLTDIISLKKEGKSKIKIKAKIKKGGTKEDFIFGPFDDVKRGSIYDKLETAWNKLCDNCEGEEADLNANIDLSKLPGQEAADVNLIFQEDPPLAALPPDKFTDYDKKEKIILEASYPIPIKSMFGILWSGESPFEKELNEKNGNENIEISEWKLSPDKVCFLRQVNFVKNSAMVSCSVKQTQKARVMNANEVRFETSSMMEGIPLLSPDAFTAETKWRVTSEGKGCHIKVSGFCIWKKNPFIKGKVDRETIKGMQDHFESFKTQLKQQIGNAGGVVEEVTLPDIPTPPAEENLFGISPIMIGLIVGIIFFFLLSMYCWWTLAGWRAIATDLKEANADLKSRINTLNIQIAAYKTGNRVKPAAKVLLEVDKRWRNNLKNAIALLDAMQSELELHSVKEPNSNDLDDNNSNTEKVVSSTNSIKDQPAKNNSQQQITENVNTTINKNNVVDIDEKAQLQAETNAIATEQSKN